MIKHIIVTYESAFQNVRLYYEDGGSLSVTIPESTPLAPESVFDALESRLGIPLVDASELYHALAEHLPGQHNPDGLTPEEVEVSEGWRLLCPFRKT